MRPLSREPLTRGSPPRPVVDLSHGVSPLDIRAGALVLAPSFPYLRHDAVVLAVVDPSVGRDPHIAVETGDGRLLVGPDNGLLCTVLAGCRRPGACRFDHVLEHRVEPSVGVVPCPRRARPGRSTPRESGCLSTSSVRRSGQRSSFSFASPFLPSNGDGSNARFSTSTASATCSSMSGTGTWRR
jgi:hypothetical protein